MVTQEQVGMKFLDQNNVGVNLQMEFILKLDLRFLQQWLLLYPKMQFKIH
jgi:hypothetical protein